MTTVLYLRHESGAMHAFGGRRCARLLRELAAGRGGPEITALVEAGYSETMGGTCLDAATHDALAREASGRMSD